MKKTELLQIRVSPEVKEALKAEAKKQGKTMSSYIEEHLKQLTESPDLQNKIQSLEDRTVELTAKIEDIVAKILSKQSTH